MALYRHWDAHRHDGARSRCGHVPRRRAADRDQGVRRGAFKGCFCRSIGIAELALCFNSSSPIAIIQQALTPEEILEIAKAEGYSLSDEDTATAGFFDIEMTRSCESDVYVGAFAEQLERRGIAFDQGAEDRYVTPENGLIPALGLA